MARLLLPDETFIPGETYLIMSIPSLKSTIIYVTPEGTIFNVKCAIAERMALQPVDIEISLHQTVLADDFLPSMIHPMHRVLDATIASHVIPHRYRSAYQPSILDLRGIYALHMVYLKTWLLTNEFQHIELSADHPRINDLLAQLGSILACPEITNMISVRIHRTQKHYHLITTEQLILFYQTIQSKKAIAIHVDPSVLDTEEVVEMDHWVQQNSPKHRVQPVGF
jgi:hypothetical protein